MSNTVLYEVKNNIAYITLNRPKKLNAFNLEMSSALRDTWKRFENNDAAKVAILNGNGKSFSVGVDLTDEDRKKGKAWQYHDAYPLNGTALFKPIVGAVRGYALGQGYLIAVTGCDITIASDDAVFGQTGASVGACPTVGATQYLPRVVGERLAKEMIFLARKFNAHEAQQIGLINKVVPKAELRKATEEWCERIKSHSGQTLRATKKALNFESDELYAAWQHGMELLAEIWGSEESLEGMNAFLEKRKPDFNKFRMRNKKQVEQYLAGLAADENRAKKK